MDSLSRRSLLRVGAGALAAWAAAPAAASAAGGVLPPGRGGLPRRDEMPVRTVSLTATPGPVDLGGRTVTTWSYDGRVPGPLIRVGVGEPLAVVVANNLPDPTTVHWHGLCVPNAQDGVPGVTQSAIAAADVFSYRFTPSSPGTYWLHPHVGLQQDRGLYAALIVDDPDEPLAYDAEWLVVLDDWIDGTGATPDDVLGELTRGSHDSGGAGGHSRAVEGDDGGAEASHVLPRDATSPLLGGPAGHVAYPVHLANGRTPDAPETFAATPGARVRIRLVNAGSDTAYRVAVGGHRMTVVHADGHPVRPVDTDALLLGMGERYDVLVTLGSGVFPLVAVAEGKAGAALALVRTGAGTAPDATVRPAELDGERVGYESLGPPAGAAPEEREPDRVIRMAMTGNGSAFDWGINGRRYDPAEHYPVAEGERVRLEFVNRTRMWHPMHVHGHTFSAGSPAGPRKDTVIVLPGRTVTADFDADNPGLWMVHCHNVYHSETGMMTTVAYEGRSAPVSP
ncbi:multicopper oxidase family protein [Yinghuangia sp. ASG 101]|uniref:multicopper oxidase family protein n=1 Tax=Yinghuangia sp. ASG 101 TaxID=2896848 RepID=UPI001E45DA46|nr:multicopper oxidase family protein [Yinghuangia sp. ASG 101]UGQ12173.1 multicopper oxidase family protein [Yinghuangia sp. ASG 101]